MLLTYEDVYGAKDTKQNIGKAPMVLTNLGGMVGGRGEGSSLTTHQT